MKLYSLLDKDLLEEMLRDGFVRRNQHPTDPVALLNYSEQAQYAKNWNNVTLNCRGLIYDMQDETILARPFEKFFNLAEVEDVARSLDGPVEVTDKMDGSLGIGYRYAGRWKVATRGSFASEQALWATRWLNETYPQFTGLPGLTPLWEIIYPENRIVLDYQGYKGLVLLAWRDIASGKIYGPESFPEDWKGHRTEVMSAYSLMDAIKLPPRENAEGVVVRWTKSGWQVKIKQEDYVRAHAVVTGMTNRSVWKVLSDGDDLPEKAAFMPDEFYDWLTDTAAEFQRAHFNLQVQVGIAYDEILEILLKNGLYTTNEFGATIFDRKEFALRATKSPYAPALFQKFDGKPIDSWCWAKLFPTTITRPWSEK